jgi:DNA-binding response OmpR family regulator
MRILLVEDDPRLSVLVQDALQRRGHAVDTEATGRGAIARLAVDPYTVVILDLGLPDLDGIEVTDTIRRRGWQVPVLILTARDAVPERIRGLESGADDYLTKPFDIDELVARVQALARRMPALRTQLLCVGDLTVDTHAMSARRGDATLPLTPKEYMVLEFLAQHAGRVVSRAEITGYAWDDNHDPASNALEVVINRLRDKLDRGRPPLLHTRRGAGYVLRSNVS